MDIVSQNGPKPSAPYTINTNTAATLQGTGLVPQIFMGTLMIVILYIVCVMIEQFYNFYKSSMTIPIKLMPDSYSTEDKSITVAQNPLNPSANPIVISNNERSGIEFTYSFFVLVHPSTFRTEKGLLHIFHKGFPGQYPLLGPGVYMRSDTNCMRVYMNTYKTWNNYVEVDNFPVGKWVHVAVVCKGSSLQVYINGNLSKKLSFDGFQAYQNYQDIICFSQRRIMVQHSQYPSTDEEGFQVFGAMKGLFSKLYYYNYALSYTEINEQMNDGPSSKMDTASLDKPPYLADNWWSMNYGV
jgi:hypothetical protein